MFFSSVWIFWSSTLILLSSSVIFDLVISVALFISISPSSSLIEDTVASVFSFFIPLKFPALRLASFASAFAFESLDCRASSSSFLGTSIGLTALFGCDREPHTGHGILSTRVSAKRPA